MINKKIAALVIGASVVVSSLGLGYKAYAENNTKSNTNVTQEQKDNGNRDEKHGFMFGENEGHGKHKGHGKGRGENSKMNNLTDAQKKEFETIHKEMNTIKTSYDNKIKPLKEAFDTAVNTGKKDEILAKFDALDKVRKEKKAKLEQLKIKLDKITGRENREEKIHPLETAIANLKKATTDADIKKAVDEIKNSHQNGRDKMDMHHRGMGKMGMMSNLTDAQKTQLESIHKEMDKVRDEFRTQMDSARDEFKKAIESQDKTKVLNAYTKLFDVLTKEKAKMTPIMDKMDKITGMTHKENVKESPLASKIESLKKATDATEIKNIINSLNDIHFFGRMHR